MRGTTAMTTKPNILDMQARDVGQRALRSARERSPRSAARFTLFGVLLSLGLAPAPGVAQDIREVSPKEVGDLLETRLQPRFVPGEVIVKLKPVGGAVPALPRGALEPLGLEASPRRTSGAELVYRFSQETLFRLESEREARARVLAVLERLQARADVAYAQPNWIVRPLDTTPQDPHYPKQWHYFNNGGGSGESPGGINLPRAWDAGTGSPAVAVAVIDTGILPGHADIVGSPNLGAGYDMIIDPFIANDGDGRDADPTDPGDAVQAGECFPGSPARPDSWHGSHVAGTVGVVNSDNTVGVAGVAWQVRMLPVRVLGKCGGTTVDINDAIRWAAGLPVPGVPANANPARVINLSLGAPVACTQSPSTQSAINDAVAAGTAVIAAAGNSAQDASGFMPASCDNVITVAASDARGHLVTRYSNFGPKVDIMAPGGDVQRDDNGDGFPDGVLSTVEGGYAFYNGTSMASPHTAGVAALLLAADPSLTPVDVRNRIQANAIPRSPAQCPKPCGAGLLNAHFERAEPPAPRARYEYAAKLVCGVQSSTTDMRLARGFYATTINVHNPSASKITLEKKLALTLPPGKQRPGKVLPIGEDELGPDQALAVDCEDLEARLFDGRFPRPYVEGFVVIRSPGSLDVRAVYTSATLNAEGSAEDHSSIHVENVPERVVEAPGALPDLVVRDIDTGTLDVECPGGGGTCVTTVDVTVANIGAGDAGAFNTRVVLDPAQSVIVNEAFPGGLPAGASQTFTVTTPPGGNCFDPDCTVCARADDKDEVAESEEGNNQLCRTRPG